jgi:hypothetical protein
MSNEIKSIFVTPFEAYNKEEIEEFILKVQKDHEELNPHKHIIVNAEPNIDEVVFDEVNAVRFMVSVDTKDIEED